MKFIVKTAPQFIFLVFGLLIVFLSFFSANRIFSQGKSLQLTEKKMYLEKEILPDHILYPVFMVFDRVRLTLASEEKKSELNISYGWQRLVATEQLLKKGYQSLSFSTLTKAYKYQNTGLIEAEGLDEATKSELVFQADQFREKVLALKPSFDDEQQQLLDRLIQEQSLLLTKLK
ncbi:MAG: DUF5667 domain-containing protein [Patescibacteria group bacterium]